MICVYCKQDKKPSNEHVISKSVLQAVFGVKIRNISGSSLFSKQLLVDHEQTICDVCEKCNSLLTKYDESGALLVSEIDRYYDLTSKAISFNTLKLGWLLKTHLNFLRMIPRKDTHEFYEFESILLTQIKEYIPIDFTFFSLLLNGWKGKDYFWKEDDERKISYFSYKSIEFPNQRIVVSNLRIKALDTFIFFPSDCNYDSFKSRCSSTHEQMLFELEIFPEQIDVEQAILEGKINIASIIPFQ